MPAADFAAYVAAAKVAIAMANARVRQPLEAEVIEDRAPFELVPNARRCPVAPDRRHPKAALLIHGLSGTPYEMRDLGRALVKACYLVRAILLPGHGTVPGDLLEVDERAWMEATRRAVESFDGVAERLVLVGYSMGATLAIDQALQAPPPGLQIAGLVLLAPELGTESKLGWLQAPRLYGALMLEGRWSRVLSDADPVRYESLPRNALLQRARLIDALGAEQEPLNLPVFVAVSADDVEVDPAAVRDWFCRDPSGPRRLIWYASAPAPESAPCRGVIARSSATGAGVVDLSHIALPIAPDNPRYGAKGAYLDCLHYYWEKDTPSWFICMDPANTAANSDVREGEVTAANLQRHVMRRLTYNPDFEAMVESMLTFLARPD
jgi:esterase/lipase